MGQALRDGARAVMPDPQPIELSIVMPCLNEAATLGGCLERAKHFLESHGIAGELLMADNGSGDGSQAIAAQQGARVVAVPEKGYGHALMGGIAAARGRWIIMGDADGSYDFARLEPFVEQLRQGYDLVVGNRFLGGIRPGAMPPLNRYLGNPLLSALGRLFFRSPVGDFYCGLRGFSRSAILQLDLRATGMEFAIEMIVKATLLEQRICEVPTTLSPDGRGRPSHLRPWRDGWRTVRFLLIYSPRWLFFYPGLLLMVAGLAVGGWLLPGPRMIGRVAYDVHTLLYAAMAVLIGFQGISFAVFTKLFALSEGLLPEPPRLKRLFRVVTLEVGLIIGGALVVVGLAGSVLAIHWWSARAFGPLEVRQTLRLVIPAATLLVLGCQIILSSFFMSILWLRRRRDDLNAAA